MLHNLTVLQKERLRIHILSSINARGVRIRTTSDTGCNFEVGADGGLIGRCIWSMGSAGGMVELSVPCSSAR